MCNRSALYILQQFDCCAVCIILNKIRWAQNSEAAFSEYLQFALDSLQKYVLILLMQIS